MIGNSESWGFTDNGIHLTGLPLSNGAASADAAAARLWWSALTAAERDAVRAYCHGADQRINGSLLVGREPAIAGTLDAALSRARPGEPRTLYRAMFCDLPTAGQTADETTFRQFPVGATVDFPGYLAAVSRRHRIDVPDPGCTVMLELRTRDGAVLGDQMPDVVLLPRQTRWRVVGHLAARSSEHRIPTVLVIPDSAIPEGPLEGVPGFDDELDAPF